MFQNQPGPFHAWLPVCAILLAVTATPAQQISTPPQHSIISLASSPRPQGELLARQAGEATFGRAPANYHVFAAASVGTDAGVETLTLNFAAETKLTRIDSKNKDFVIEPGGTCHEGNSYARGGSCSLLVRFNPQGPGHRLGFIRVSNSVEATPMSFGLVGNGYSPVVSFTPSQINTVPVTVSAGTGVISGASSIAVDGGDIVYIADTGNNKIEEIDSSGALNPVNAFGAAPASIAVDTAGILYTANIQGSSSYFSFYTPWLSATTYFTPYAPGSCTPSTPCPLTTVGMGSPAGMSIDAYDDLIFEEKSKGAAEMPVASVSGGTGSLSLWYLKDQYAYTSPTPTSFAVDANANTYTYYNFSSSTCLILEESLYDAEYAPSATRVAGGVTCGFSGDGGQGRGAEISTKLGQIAFDIAGNLYFADAGNQRVRRIDASTGIINTIAGNGTAGYTGDNAAATKATLSSPTGVAVDSQGQVYILSNAPTAGPTQVLRKVGVFGNWSFPSQLKGTLSAPKVFNVANTGNSALTLSAAPFFTGANPADFVIDPATTSCVLTAGAVLAAGRSCNLGIDFQPSAGGTRQAHLVMTDNTVAGGNSIYLVGIGSLPAPTMTITSPTSGSSVKTGVTVTFSVSVTSSATTKPTGTVTFKANGATIGSPVTLSSGTASTTFSEPSANTYTLSAIYSGDANYATVTVSESLIVTNVKLAAQVSLTPNPTAMSGCGAQTFSVRVSSASGGSPTGTVQLKSGNSVLSSVPLSNSSATLSAGTLPAGSHSFVANYGGDSLHLPATSAPVTVNVPAVLSCSGSNPPPVGAIGGPIAP
jgi:hypothetical protein